MAVSVWVVLKLCSRHEGITCTVRHDRTNGREREVVAGDERLVGHGTVEQSAPRRLRKHRVSIDCAVAGWVLREQGRYVRRVAQHHQLLPARPDNERSVARGMAWCCD